MFWYILETRCTSTNCTRSGCTREAHVSQWVDHSHSNVEPCWAGDESARRRVRGATCQFLLRLFNLDQAPRLHRAPQESSLPTTLWREDIMCEDLHTLVTFPVNESKPCTSWASTFITIYPLVSKYPLIFTLFFQFWVFFRGFWWRVWWKAVAGGAGGLLWALSCLRPERERERVCITFIKPPLPQPRLSLLWVLRRRKKWKCKVQNVRVKVKN